MMTPSYLARMNREYNVVEAAQFSAVFFARTWAEYLTLLEHFLTESLADRT